MYSQFTRFTTLIVLFVMLVLGAWIVPTSPSLARSTTVNVSANDSNAAGCDATVDLSGWFTGNNQAKIYNNSTTCSYDVGLASYKKYDEVTDHQTLFDATTDVVAPKQTITLRVSAPQCASQIDAFWGKPLDSLMGARYGKRLLSVRHIGGNNYCSRTCSDGSVTNWIGVSSGDVIIGNVDIGVGASGIPAYAIEFQLTGAKAYNHTERVAPYLFTGSTWDTTLVPVGNYRMSATYLAAANVRCSTITVDFSIARAPNPTATAYPTPTSEPTATATATNEPTATATNEPTVTTQPTATATATSEPTATATATNEPTATATVTPPQLRGVLSAVVKLAPRDGRPSAPESGISGFVRPGDTLQYTIKVDNFGGSAATNVSVLDVLSPATTFTGVSTIAPSSQPVPDQLQWVIGSIAAGSSWEVTFEATVDTDITGVYTLIPNIASVSSDSSWFNTNSLTYLYDPAITP